MIDKTGKEILKTDYEAMGDLNKKLIYVLKGKKFGFIDSAGNIIVKLLIIILAVSITKESVGLISVANTIKRTTWCLKVNSG